MGLGEGAGQGPGPPAPAAADQGRSAPEPPLLRHLSRAPGVEGAGKTARRQEGRPALPLGPKLPAAECTEMTLPLSPQDRPLCQRVTPASRPGRPSLGAVRGLSSREPRRGGPRCRYPSRDRTLLTDRTTTRCSGVTFQMMWRKQASFPKNQAPRGQRSPVQACHANYQHTLSFSKSKYSEIWSLIKIRTELH